MIILLVEAQYSSDGENKGCFYNIVYDQESKTFSFGMNFPSNPLHLYECLNFLCSQNVLQFTNCRYTNVLKSVDTACKVSAGTVLFRLAANGQL